jgi:hypothetical protein
MRVTAMLAMAAVVGMTAYAEDAAETVTVYLDNTGIVPASVLCRSKALAADMFAGAGVHIQFRTGQPADAPTKHDRTLLVRLSNHTANNTQPGAFAFALPYEGVHITVFYDRVEQAGNGPQTPSLLAHVLVHEITHILQGISRHSESGVMKAHWAGNDYFAMTQKPFPFTTEDVDLIHIGLKARTVMLAAK